MDITINATAIIDQFSGRSICQNFDTNPGKEPIGIATIIARHNSQQVISVDMIRSACLAPDLVQGRPLAARVRDDE